MAPKTPNDPPDNIFAIDLNPYKPFLVDLGAGATKGMRTEQPGWVGARSEIVDNQPKYGDRAGITDTDFNRFMVLDDQYGQILAYLPRVKKAHEVLRESLAHVDNQRHKLATQFANTAESHAVAEGRDPTLPTAYEKTIAYRSIIADKAVKTREKHEEEAKKAAGAPPAGPAAAAPVKPPAAAPAAAAPVTPAAAAPVKPPAAAPTVSRIPNPPPDMIFKIDLGPLKSFLVDLPPLATRGMRTEQEGWQGVFDEVVNNQKAYGDRAGITKTDFNRFVALDDQYQQITLQIPVLAKAEEILVESLAHIDDQRHKLLTQFANAAEAHAAAEGEDPTLLTAYEKSIAYRSIIADKGVKTRKKSE